MSRKNYGRCYGACSVTSMTSLQTSPKLWVLHQRHFMWSWTRLPADRPLSGDIAQAAAQPRHGDVTNGLQLC